MQYLLDKNNLNLALSITIIITLFFIFTYSSKARRIDALLNPKNSKKSRRNKKNKRLAFAKLKEKLHIALLLRDKESLSNTIFNTILLSLFFVFIFFLSIDHLLLAITLPILAYIFIFKIIEEMIIDFDKIVRDNFSTLANHMVKIFSGTNDLGIVLYESSKEVEEPLRSLILNLSREIMTDNSEKNLINFIEKTENLWLHSFVFTLINYKETSSKEDIIENLLTLSELIDKRNDMSDKMIADRKPVVIVNYMLLVVGIVIFIVNLVLNPIMKSFIFTPMGTFSLIIGVSCMFLTVIVNMRFTKQ